MRQLTIAVDVDDVLAENAAGFVKFSNRRWGTNLTVDDYDEHWARMWQVDSDELKKRADEVHTSSVMRSYGHIGGAHASLSRLSSHHKLVIATSRRLEARQDTLDWVEEHFSGIFTNEAVYFAGIWDDKITSQTHLMTKADLVSEIKADLLVDDQLKHCLAVAESGRQALLFGDYSWNQSKYLPKGVTRCVNWNEVEIEVERIAQI